MTPRWLRRVFAILRHAFNLWKADIMPLTLESITDHELALFQRQSDLEGIPLESWVRNRLLGGVSKMAQAGTRPATPQENALTAASLGMDAVDLAFQADDENPEGAAPVFPASMRAGESEAHARVKGSGQSPGPLATVERVDGHPCKHLERRYLANFTANDCQGTCGSPQRGESVCTWPPGAARNCAYFGPKMRPVPPPSLMPRQG